MGGEGGGAQSVSSHRHCLLGNAGVQTISPTPRSRGDSCPKVILILGESSRKPTRQTSGRGFEMRPHDTTLAGPTSLPCGVCTLPPLAGRTQEQFSVLIGYGNMGHEYLNSFKFLRVMGSFPPRSIHHPLCAWQTTRLCAAGREASPAPWRPCWGPGYLRKHKCSMCI